LHETADVRPSQEFDAEQKSRKRILQFGAASLVGGLVQGACALLIVVNSGKALLGIAFVTVAARSSFLHSDPVRISLMIASALGALLVLYALWNGWRLRNSSGASWRRRPLTKRERWSMALALACSLLTWALVVGEYFAHPIMHPR
jgi:hypothetical protein